MIIRQLASKVVARVLLAVIAQALLLVGRPKDACVAYGYCAHVFGPAGGDEAEAWKEGVRDEERGESIAALEPIRRSWAHGAVSFRLRR